MKHIFLCLMLFALCLSPIMAQTRISSEYIVRTFIDDDGNSIDEIIVPGRPPIDHREPVVELPDPNLSESINILSNVPAFDWSYGCSATSGAMIAGYYDNGSYPNMYTGPTNGGVVPMNNSTWGAGECPLSATHQGYDGLAVRGHVDDYWSAYGSSIDPYYGNWTEHGYADCTADFMGTNQYCNWQNTDGSTIFYYYTNGTPIFDYTGCEPAQKDGCHGLREFFESRGYSIQTDGNYSQYIYGYNGNTQGFSYNQFKAEIDAERPVLIHIEGHTMVGFGYDDSTNLVYLHDTWDYSDHTMTWGGSYSGMQHFGVSVFNLQPVTGNMVEGHAFLENQTNHSGIEVLFEMTAPSNLTYTTSTNTSGYYVADIEPGVYDITYSKDGYFSEQLTEQSLYSTTTLPDITLIEHSSLLRVPSVFPTIQSAIDVYSIGDTILVATGTYVENIQFNQKSPILISEAGPDSTIIDGSQGYAIFVEEGGGEVNGFSIKNSNIGLLSDSDNDYLLIQSCIFFENYKAINLQATYNTDIVNTLIYENDFGVVQNYYGGSSTIVNCTFDNNVDIYFYPFYTEPASLEIVNSILLGQILYFDLFSVNLSYCNYNPANIGTNVTLITGNIIDDPLFVDQVNHDYHLQSNSPCIDAGDPSAFFNDINGTRNDMGYTGASGLFIRRSNFDFGYITCSSSSNQYLSISNHLAGSFTISSYNTNNSQFQVNESFPLTISSGDLYELELAYNSTSSGSTSGTITFNSDDLIGASSADIQVMGYGIDYTGGTIHVPSLAPTIQSAIDVCSIADTILVAPGTYVENIQFNHKSPVLISESGPDSTIIDGNQGDAILVDGGGGVIKGFSITESNFGVYKRYDNSQLLIYGCDFFNNSNAINLDHTNNTDIVNTLFYGNDLGFYQRYYGGDGTTITNCTFDNTQDILFVPAYGTISELDIYNSILRNLIEGSNQNPVNLYYCDYDPANLSTNVNLVVGNITDDPLFVDQTNNDYHLQPNSPCIDAGDPTSPFDPDGTIADMGTYYFNQIDYFPIADFEANLTTGDVPLSVIFTDLSAIGSMGTSIDNWAWDFNNDGTVDSYEQNPIHAYALPGLYTVSLTVFDGTYQDTETKLEYITVNGNIIDGYAFLENQTNHSGIKVLFERTAPSSYSDSTYIDSTGYFILGLPDGLYNITYSKDNYFNEWLTDQTLYSNTTLTDITLSEHTTILNVPSVFPSIQSAIDHAFDADTILVQPGTYFENINFLGKNIILASEFLTTQDTSYISQTLIDGDQQDRVISFENGENITAVLYGFTITNGHAYFGGGIYCNNSSPRLENLTIIGNWANSLGGGVYCENSSPSLEYVTITNNWANSGGGISCNYSSPILENATITGNSAGDRGGGVYCSHSSPSLENVTISGNSASQSSSYGGGICCWDNSSPSLENVTITGNSASTGGGISCNYSSPILENVTITGNSANNYGSGIYCYFSSPSLVNTIVSDNTGNFGIYVVTGNPSITYSDFYNNQNGNFYNCNQWIGINVTTNANVDSCDVFYNIQLDPFFMNASNGDYYLTENSPCIDAGNPTFPLDPDGTIADMGAYFYDQSYPSADFIADITTGTTPLIASFTDLSQTGTLGYPITDWSWDFDNDGNVDSNDQSPQWSYYERGSYSVSLSVMDGTRSDVEIKVGYITVVNSQPTVIDSIPDFSFEEDTVDFSIDLNNVFSDADLPYGDSLSFSYSGNTNIQVDLVDGNVTLTPTGDWFGSEVITLTATDDQNTSISDDVEVTVNPINDPPILDITGTYEADEDLPSQTYDFNTFCTQTWGETDILTLTADNSTHISVIITDFNVVFESNTLNWYGTEDVTFYLNDNVADDSRRSAYHTKDNSIRRISLSQKDNSRDIVSQTISVTVNPINDPPILNITGSFEADEDLPSQIYDFSTFCTQAWGETDLLTLTAGNSAHINVSINGFDVIFQSNTNNWYGTGDITFYLDDNVSDTKSSRDIVQQTIQVTINPINDPPILNITGTFEADEDLPSQTYDFTSFCTQVWGETDVLTLTASNSSHIDVTINNFDVIFESNTLNWYGTEDITFYLDDNVTESRSSRYVVEQTIQVTVNPINDPPSIVLPDDFTFDEDNNLLVDFSTLISDIEPDNLTLSVIGNTEIIVLITGTDVTFSAPSDWFGYEILTFTVDDNVTEATASDDVLVIVDPVNDPPILNITGTFEADEDLPSQTYDFSIFCSQTWGETDVLTLTADNSAHINVSITSFDVVFESNTLNWNGTEDITFFLNDNVTVLADWGNQKHRNPDSSSRDIVEQTISVTIIPINDPPTIVLPDDFTFDEDNELLVDFEQYISDIDEDDLTLSVEGNVNVLVNINGTEISFSAIENWNGDEMLTFTVDDNATDATASDDVLVIVDPVNDPPEMISYIPEELSFTVVQDSTVTFSVEAEDIDSYLVYEWFVDGELQMEIIETFDYQFQEAGSTSITSNISDGEYNIETLWEISVEPVSSGGDILISATKLYQNYPNPFNPTTTICFDIKESEKGMLTIFNLKGQIIVSEEFDAGQHSYRWDGNNCGTGLYFYRLNTDTNVITRKMVMMK